MVKNLQYNALISISAILVSLAIGFTLSLLIGINYRGFVSISISIVLINSFVFGIATVISLFLIRDMVLEDQKVFIILVTSLGIILGAGTISLVTIFFTHPIALIYSENRTFPYLMINLLFFITINFVLSGFTIYQENIARQKDRLQEEKYLKSKIELQLLASKINPHFLFNSLNLMVSLLKKPEQAEEALIYLSDILRHQLDYSQSTEINLELELDIVKKYLAIQKMRFGDKLSFEIESYIKGRIPPFIIQPLVENCIKHNIDSADLLVINVKAKSRENLLIITVTDSCARLETSMLNNGVGLSVTKKRIEAFGGEFNIVNGGIEISIVQ